MTKKCMADAKEEIKMDHYEMVEKLRAKANVSYEEAKAALEASDWDILDALVLLESEGKVKGEEAAPEFTTQQKPVQKAKNDHDVKEGIAKVWKLLKKLFQKGNSNQFVISRNGQEILPMPITVAVVVALMLWPASAIALIISLFFGVRYTFRGPDISEKVNDTVNKVMDKAASAVEVHLDEDENKGE